MEDSGRRPMPETPMQSRRRGHPDANGAAPCAPLNNNSAAKSRRRRALKPVHWCPNVILSPSAGYLNRLPLGDGPGVVLGLAVETSGRVAGLGHPVDCDGGELGRRASLEVVSSHGVCLPRPGVHDLPVPCPDGNTQLWAISFGELPRATHLQGETKRIYRRVIH